MRTPYFRHGQKLAIVRRSAHATFMKFSTTKRRFITTAGKFALALYFIPDCSEWDSLNTITIKFLKPKKFGDTSESWLKWEFRVFEWTAAICRYLDTGLALPLFSSDTDGFVTAAPLISLWRGPLLST